MSMVEWLSFITCDSNDGNYFFPKCSMLNLSVEAPVQTMQQNVNLNK